MSLPRLIGVAVGGCVAALAVIVGVVFGVRGCTRESEQPPVATGPTEGSRAASEGMNAPGTSELRKLGCASAMVMDMTRVMGGPSKFREGEPHAMVTCQMETGTDGAPTCERVGATYLTALGGNAEANFAVRVSQSGSSKPVCTRLFAPNGADLGPFER